MSNTPRLGLPLLQAAQAQKHVTVNEALVLVDAGSQLTLLSVAMNTPPALASDGDCYGVAVGGVNGWAGHDGEVAVRSNSGWVFLVPQKGWRAHVVDLERPGLFDGAGWVAGALALSANNAATVHEVIEIDHVLGAGPTDAVLAAIPASTIVLGITGRVTTALTGALTGWQLGVASAVNRYGSGLGLAQASWVRGLTSFPQAYYADTDLLLTGEAGDFAGGGIRFAVHLLRLNIPMP